MSRCIVDVEQILDNYAWKTFTEARNTKLSCLDEFKGIVKDDVDFVLNRKNLSVVFEEPQYINFAPGRGKPCTLFTSIFTNNTDRPQEYSFKTERTTESLCAISREQGYTIGTEAELTLKTPGEIAEFKAGFKHEMHFATLNESAVTETLSWSVDSNVQVPAKYQTVAAIVIEESNYRGSYSVVTKLSGTVVISLRRRRDNALILPVLVDVAEVFRALLESRHCPSNVKTVAKIDGQTVHLTSRGKCQFQFASKQRIDLTEKALVQELIL